jgi:hypothetical protein
MEDRLGERSKDPNRSTMGDADAGEVRRSAPRAATSPECDGDHRTSLDGLRKSERSP